MTGDGEIEAIPILPVGGVIAAAPAELPALRFGHALNFPPAEAS